MQDNYTKIDKKFTNLAWAEMEKMLDKEMPVQKEKRRGWKRYFLLLLLLIGVGVAFGWMALSDEVEKEKPPQNEEIPIAQVDNLKNIKYAKTIDSQSVKNDKTNTLTNKAGLSKTFNELEKTQSQSSNPSKSGTKNYANSSVQNLKKSKNNSEVLKFEKSNLIANNESENKDEVIVLNPNRANEGINSKLEKWNDSRNEIEENLEAIASLTLNELDYENTHGLECATSIDPVQKKGILHPDVLKIKSNGIFHPVYTYDGISGGIAAEYPFENKRWGIETGAFYDYIQTDPTVNSSGIFSLQADELFSPIEENLALAEYVVILDNSRYNVSISNGSVLGGIADLDSNSVYSVLKLPMNLHYLRLPFDLFYKISPKWKVRGGMNLAFLLASPSTTTGGIFSSKSISNKNIDPLSADVNGLGNKTPIHNMDVGVSLGVDYQLSKKLELGFQYNHGLVDHLSLNNLNSHNQYFQLSLAYKFK